MPKLNLRSVVLCLLVLAGLLLVLALINAWRLGNARNGLKAQPALQELAQAPELMGAQLAQLRTATVRGRLISELRQRSEWFEAAITSLEGRNPVAALGGAALLEVSADAVARLRQAWTPAGKEIQDLLALSDPSAEGVARVYSRFDGQLGPIRQELAAVTGEHMASVEGRLSGVIWTLLLGSIALLLAAAWLLRALLGQLKRERDQLDRRALEAESILGAIGDGLLLVDRAYTIGDQYSEATEQIFNRKELGGLNLFGLIQGLVTEKTLSTAKDYLDLLFGERVNEKLVQDLNPLDVVEFHFDNGRGGFESKYLGFRFKRVFVAGELSHLLVTVTDITRRVAVEKELREQQEKTQAQMDMLVELLHVDPDTLSSFLPRAQQMLLDVNQILKEPVRDSGEYKSKLDQIFRLVHGLKGEAGVIELKSFQNGAHELEALLTEMRARPNLGGNDFLTFTIKLEELFTQLDAVRVLLGRLAQLRQAFEAQAQAQQRRPKTGEQPAVRAAQPSLVDMLETVVQQIAARQGKRVRVSAQGLEDSAIPARYQPTLREILVQLARNAVVHGIETPRLRINRAKPEIGQIVVVFKRTDDGYELLFRDDGAGIDTGALKAAAQRSGVRTRQQLAAMSENDAMALIFEPSLSTSAQVDEDSGRGVGLDLVRHRVSELDGQLRLATATGKGTQFKVLLKA